VLELGGAGEQSLKGGGANFGPTIAVEVTPIENRPELEGGVTPLYDHGKTEWDTDLLFKKPWTLGSAGISSQVIATILAEGTSSQSE